MYSMRVTVICLREMGRPVPRWRVSRLPSVTGRLVVGDRYHPTIRRTVRAARIITDSRDVPCPFPESIDIQIHCLSLQGQARRREAIAAGIISLILFVVGFAFAFHSVSQ